MPFDLYLAQQCRELDRLAMEKYRISGFELMQRAGRAAFSLARNAWPQAVKWTVVCGPGNNGGDGFIMATLAQSAGLPVKVCLIGDAGKLSGDAARAYACMREAGVKEQALSAAAFAHTQCVVDALYGTGLDRAVNGAGLEAINAMNASQARVLAIDVPSGLHADRGVVLGAAVRASATISFIGRKQGLYTGQGPEFGGRVFYNDLQVPRELYSELTPAARLVDAAQCAHNLPRRPRDMHKGALGHVLVLGGTIGMAGAASMAARAASFGGAGLVSIATHPAHAAILNCRFPEIMVHAVEKPMDLQLAAEKATVLALGPGLGTGAWSQRLMQCALTLSQPKVIDADGLNLLARLARRNEDWILTPHPGEAGRLLGITTAQVQQNRFEACRSIAQRYGGVCVLKGAGSLICSEPAGMRVNTSGNPGMATGGMGDALTGFIAALLAQGVPAADAAALACATHGASADVLRARVGERGLQASELLTLFRELLNAHHGYN